MRGFVDYLALEDRLFAQLDKQVYAHIPVKVGVPSIATPGAVCQTLAAGAGTGIEWNAVLPEYGPYKYGSFAVNAGGQTYRLTLEIRSRLGHVAVARESLLLSFIAAGAGVR